MERKGTGKPKSLQEKRSGHLGVNPVPVHGNVFDVVNGLALC